MKQTTRVFIAFCLLLCFGVIVVFAQVALPDGKKLWNHSQDHVVLPNGSVTFTNVVPTPTVGEINGAIRVDGSNAYIFAGGVWRKFTTATATPTPTPTP